MRLGKEMGMEAYILKPFEHETLIAKIRASIREGA